MGDTTIYVHSDSSSEDFHPGRMNSDRAKALKLLNRQVYHKLWAEINIKAAACLNDG